jgi:hypothetical protein
MNNMNNMNNIDYSFFSIDEINKKIRKFNILYNDIINNYNYLYEFDR